MMSHHRVPVTCCAPVAWVGPGFRCLIIWRYMTWSLRDLNKWLSYGADGFLFQYSKEDASKTSWLADFRDLCNQTLIVIYASHSFIFLPCRIDYIDISRCLVFGCQISTCWMHRCASFPSWQQPWKPWHQLWEMSGSFYLQSTAYRCVLSCIISIP